MLKKPQFVMRYGIIYITQRTSNKMSLTKNAFAHFGLEKSILSALSDLGYERATPIQEQGIPILLNGEDLLAQAQTGTGKTATFALPILSRLDHAVRAPQALILVPTRELAIQVAEAFQSYAKQMKGFSVTPIYGGQDFNTQLRSLKRGSQVIVGTPGRLMDHMRRKTLPLNALKAVVLDEADEMLKMGFAEDVEWILGQLNAPHQTALFSATLSPSIQKIAQRYLKDAKKIQIKSQTNTVEAIEQCYVSVSNRNQKLDVLTRLLEVEENQAVIIFTRTKTESTELAERLQARGHSAAALNGDMSQGAREKTINRLKKGELDILIATDVAARGIDVDRISHVINYDIPYDVDAYVHRIGRTGRAGRAGKAILFVTPREMRLFSDIERHINKSIKRIEPPSLKVIREKRTAQLSEKVLTVIREKGKQLAPYVEIVMALTEQHALAAKDLAAALMFLSEEQSASGDLPVTDSSAHRGRGERSDRGRGSRDRDRGSRDRHPRDQGNRGRPFENRSGDRFSEDDKPKPRRKFGERMASRHAESAALKDSKEFKAPRETREFKGPRDPKAFKGPREFKGSKESSGFKERSEKRSFKSGDASSRLDRSDKKRPPR
ncbi:MAG: hypothetical protein A3F13_03005 [Gammaproteobacteria bacterium RIFCSPHIGHO2_12_FULL_40_19]|nr:MAG: hypothetical protein A3F13_03005 [Gammaproteobacteria bacterium RIFCSPHIGHO2_12_FULL_40_19]